MTIELARLADPFPSSDIEWRIGQAGKSGEKIWAKVLAYITNRAIMDRLDQVVGHGNWCNTKPEKVTVMNDKGQPVDGFIVGLSLKIDGEWVTKWDGADCTDIEPLKGGLSGAMKRAGVQWGIGRYLYDLEEGWAEVFDKKDKETRYANCKIKVNGKEEWVNFHWKPPHLPGWALPAPPAATHAPKPQAKPAAAPASYDGLRQKIDNITNGKLFTDFRAEALAAFHARSITAVQLGTLIGSLTNKASTINSLNGLGKWIAEVRMEMGSDDAKCFDDAEELITNKVKQLSEQVAPAAA